MQGSQAAELLARYKQRPSFQVPALCWYTTAAVEAALLDANETCPHQLTCTCTRGLQTTRNMHFLVWGDICCRWGWDVLPPCRPCPAHGWAGRDAACC